MKTTLFRDPAFVAQTRGFIPVYLDGDTRGAQGWGERFGVSGYPSVIILRPDRSEIARLANGAAPAHLAEVLRAAAVRTTSTDALLHAALADPARLSGDDWTLLRNYEWMNDPRHFTDPGTALPTLDRLTAAAPTPVLRRAFAFDALAIRSFRGKLGAADQARIREILPPLLASREETRADTGMLVFAAPRLVAALDDPADRERLGRAVTQALDGIADDGTVSAPDRVDAIDAEVTLAKAANGGKAPAATLAMVRERTARLDRSASDPMTRQALVPAIAETLDDAGDPQGAIRYLKANLATAVAPAYHMSLISGVEDELGRKAEAVDWARRAFEAALGPATRIQWAIAYSNATMKLTPADTSAVEHGADAVLAALADNDAGYYQRTRRKLEAWNKRLTAWNTAHGDAPLLARVRVRLAQACAASVGALAGCGPQKI